MRRRALLVGAASALVTARRARGEARAEQVLGRFVTTYAVDAESRGRAFNVELAASALDGRVVGPSALMSFNDAVGERTAAFGFERATVLRDRMLAEGVGGGACQVASTLHAAALLAGLEIAQRAPHSRPSAYIRVGLDATVAFGKIDLRVRNPLDVPVRVRANAKNGMLRVTIEGAATRPEVTLTSTITESTPPPRAIERGDDVSEGVVRVVAYGIPGYRVERRREVKRGGALHRDLRVDVYPATPEVLRVSRAFDLARITRGVPQGDGRGEDDGVRWETAGAARPALVQVRPSTSVRLTNAGEGDAAERGATPPAAVTSPRAP